MQNPNVKGLFDFCVAEQVNLVFKFTETNESPVVRVTIGNYSKKIVVQRDLPASLISEDNDLIFNKVKDLMHLYLMRAYPEKYKKPITPPEHEEPSSGDSN